MTGGGVSSSAASGRRPRWACAGARTRTHALVTRQEYPSTVAVVSGLQFLLAFLNFDIANLPRRPMHPLFRPPELPSLGPD